MGPRERPHCFLGGVFSCFVICGSRAARLGDGGLDFPARARCAAAAWDQALADDRDRGKRRGVVLSVVCQCPRLGQCRPGHDQPDAEDRVAVTMYARPDQPRRRFAGAAFADDRLAPRGRRGRSHRHRDAALSPDDKLMAGAKSTPCVALWLHRSVLPARSREAKHWMQYSAPSEYCRSARALRRNLSNLGPTQSSRWTEHPSPRLPLSLAREGPKPWRGRPPRKVSMSTGPMRSAWWRFTFWRCLPSSPGSSVGPASLLCSSAITCFARSASAQASIAA